MDATRKTSRQPVNESQLLISRDALLHNAAIIKRALANETPPIARPASPQKSSAAQSPGAPYLKLHLDESNQDIKPSVLPRICAVVKADAYGLGAEHVVDALYNFSSEEIQGPAVDALAVANVDEADALPATSLPVIIFRPVENGLIRQQRAQIEAAIRNNWTMTVGSAAAANDIARIAMSIHGMALVQIMVDTGLTRTGICEKDFMDVLGTIVGLPSLRLTGIGTHFSSADQIDNPATAEQIRQFRDCTDRPLELLRKSHQHRIHRHAANSAGIFLHPTSHFDMVRPGLSLYGLDPLMKPCTDRKLKPVMKWIAPLVNVREVAAGTKVGYGQTWTTPRATKIGLVPVGYADGYLRAFSNQAKMMIDNKPVPVVGTVSMDYTAIDLGPNSAARTGDTVTVLDDDPLSPASVYSLANIAKTIPYEILCRIGPRIARVMKEPEDGEQGETGMRIGH